MWGSSISAYQTEGNNFNSDWYLWEKEHNLEEAGECTNHYYVFPEDFSLARYLGHNALRFSIEWSRICPTPNSFDEEQLKHYLEVLCELENNSITPIVCLHHFTNPLWFTKNGGWLRPSSVDYFVRYTDVILKNIGRKVKFWITFNEPLVYLYNGFLTGRWPPGLKSYSGIKKALKNIIKAHSICYHLIKKFYDDEEVKVSITKHLRFFSPCPFRNWGQNSFYSFVRDGVFNWAVINYLYKRKLIDFLGVNYYCQEFVRGGGSVLFGRACEASHHKGERNKMNWFVFPEGLYRILIRLRRYALPVIITENGTADRDNLDYERFLKRHLASVAQAIQEGVDVRGYLWWSLLDNFEWHKGFGYRFGLIEVDYRTFSRRIKPFALTYKKICQCNAIDI